MKKFLIILLALAMLCTFAACDNAQPVVDPNVVDDDVPAVNGTVDNAAAPLDGRLAGQYAEMMMNGHYYMESTSYVMGMEFSTIVAVDGENSDSIGNAFGYQTRTLILDGIIYNIDETNKTYTATPVDTATETTNNNYDYTNMEYTSSGNSAITGLEEIDTNSYDYEEYTCTIDANGSTMTIPLRFYMNDGNLYAIQLSAMGIDTVMIITTMSADIPADMLQLPEGYTEVSGQ